MKKQTLYFVVLLMLGLCACETKYMDLIEYYDNLNESRYIPDELFTESQQTLYGTWSLYAIDTTIEKAEDVPYFEYLEVKENGIYGFFNDGDVVDFGVVIPIESTVNDTFDVYFQTRTESPNVKHQRYITFDGSDTLHLFSITEDEANYHLARE